MPGVTCDTCAELRERIAYLESELRIQADDTEFARVKSAFGLQPMGVRILLALWKARGGVVSVWRLEELIRGMDGDCSENLIRVHICRMRSGIGRDAVENVWGRGYRLSGEAINRVDAVLDKR